MFIPDELELEMCCGVPPVYTLHKDGSRRVYSFGCFVCGFEADGRSIVAAAAKFNRGADPDGEAPGV